MTLFEIAMRLDALIQGLREKQKPNNSFDEGARDHDELSFGVVRTPEDDETIVEQSFVVDLSETLEVTTQKRKLLSRG